MITRRTFLQGTGAMIALPWFETFAQDAAKAPLRMAFLYYPNGVIVPEWNYEATLKPLVSLKDELILFRGLTHDKARANGDGPGDHARAAATFLTGCQARKTDGKDIKVGVSVDQLAAQHSRTKLPSLELGCESGALAGNCDSGYSCAYSSSIAWKSPSLPLGKIVKPRQAFDRIFGDPDVSPEARDRSKSVLDFVEEDAKRLESQLGSADRAKLGDYLQAVREVEKQVESVEKDTRPKMDVPEGVPEYRAHVKLMLDLLVLAFRADATRVATLMFANEGSDRTYRFLGVREGHHTLSHHGGAKDKLEKIQKIDQFHIEQFAYFLQEMRKAQLLDHSMIVFGSAIGDGNAHNHEDLPVLWAGRANGTVTTGRELTVKPETPMANLYLSMLDRMDVRIAKFGDSTGRVELKN